MEKNDGVPNKSEKKDESLVGRKSIKHITIRNVMAFQSHRNAIHNENGDSYVCEDHPETDLFQMDFIDGINIIMGENGVGKTTILKMIYAATQWSISKTDQRKTKQLTQFFSII